jgi:hypothetical protein
MRMVIVLLVRLDRRAILMFMRKQINEWRRLHAVEPAVTLRVVTSPLDGWIVTIEGWTAQSHFCRTHPDIE